MASGLPECPKCLEEYSRTQMPMLLPCGHALCKLCFYELKEGNKIICPLDRQESNIRNLSPAYDLMSTIEQLQELKFQINQESKPKVDSQSHDNSKTEILEKQFNEFKEFEEKCKESTEKMIAEIKREEEERRNKCIEQVNETNRINTQKHLAKLNKKIRQGKIRINDIENDQNHTERRIPRDDNRIYWSWQSSGHKWNEYDYSISSKIESAYRSGSSYMSVKLNNKNIKIDFDQWREVNGPKIKRINTITSAPLWKFMKSYRNWEALTDSECFELDKAWLSNKNHISIKIASGKVATCDLNDMFLKIEDEKLPLVREILS